MNKAQFMKELTRRLSDLPAPELKKSLEYYSEIIDDRMEDGMDEAQAVQALGDMDGIAREAMRDMQLEASAKAPKKRSAWKTALLVLGFPVWGSLLAAFAAVVVALYVSLWAVVISLAAADAALLLSGAACALFSCLMFSQKIITGLFLFGSGLLVFGVGLLFLPIMKKLCQLSVRLTTWLWRKTFRKNDRGGAAR